jgi:hypothetical protein
MTGRCSNTSVDNFDSQLDGLMGQLETNDNGVNFDLSDPSLENLSNHTFNENLSLFSDDIEPLSSLNDVTSPTDTRSVLDSDISDSISPDIKSNVLYNTDEHIGGLSDYILENSTLSNNTTDSLGGLYGNYDNSVEYGTPSTDAMYWRQQEGGYSCAVVAQICVYESLTGEYISEDDAATYAQQQGWFDPNGGTLPADIGNILEVLNIDTYKTNNASLADLEYALARGDKPIVGLDGNEIWNPQYDWYGQALEQTDAGHAVWVTGIDYQSNGSASIILNDSGTPYGMSSVVDYDDFMNAWQDYGYFVTIADNPDT